MNTILAAHDPAEHVLPHRFFELLPFNFNFGVKVIPILGIDFGPSKFYFTNHHLMMIIAALLCLLVFPAMARKYAGTGGEPRAPRGSANLLEAMMQFIRENVARPVLNERTDAFMPLLWTLFFFILFCNLLGMIPLDSIIYLISGRRVEHLGGTATGNLGVTGGLAICAFIAIHVSGVRAVYKGLIDGTYGHHEHPGHEEETPPEDVNELRREVAHQDHGNHPYHAPTHRESPGAAAMLAVPLYVWNFAPHVFKPDPHAGAFSKLMLSVLDIAMWAILLVLEFLGAVIKPFALMIRLFANMVAGHIVLASILGLIFVTEGVAMGYFVGVASALGSAALSLLELFVAFLQAYIFTFLTALFIGASVAPEH